MFGNNSQVQLAVLQERFKAHEQIIEKVDTAIQTLSETNQNICKMLAVHDERLDQCIREDGDIIEKVGKIETKIEELVKFRWMAAGVVAVALLFFPIINNVISSTVNSFIHQSKTK